MIEKIFCCTKCGFCCQGETTVSLDENDLKRMQKVLDISQEDMFEKYLVVSKSQVQMKTVDGHCIFYSKKGCSVHSGRPWRCREWPLHKSILKDEANFQTVASSCPGIEQEIKYEDFCNVLTQVLDDVETKGGWGSR